MGVFLIFAIPLIALTIFFVLICVASSNKAEVRLLDEKSGYYEDKIKSKFWNYLYNNIQGEIGHFVVGVLMVIFALVCIGLSIGAIVVHTKQDIKYQETYQQYVILTARLEDDNNYHLFYEDICAYNNAILEDRYWADNLWVNWYHNGKIQYLPLIGENADNV